MSLAIRVNDFYFFIVYQKVKNCVSRSTSAPKTDTFGHIGIRDLANLGVDNVVFWTFVKFFKSRLGSV